MPGGPRRSKGCPGGWLRPKLHERPGRTFPARLPSGSQRWVSQSGGVFWVQRNGLRLGLRARLFVEVDVPGGPRRSKGCPGGCLRPKLQERPGRTSPARLPSGIVPRRGICATFKGEPGGPFKRPPGGPFQGSPGFSLKDPRGVLQVPGDGFRSSRGAPGRSKGVPGSISGLKPRRSTISGRPGPLKVPVPF